MEVGLEELEQVEVVGQGTAHQDVVEQGGGVEIGDAGGVGDASHTVAAAVLKGFLNLGTAEVVLDGLGVGWAAAVEEHASAGGDDGDTHLLHGFHAELMEDGGGVVERLDAEEDVGVEVLQAGVEELGLVALLAVVLEGNETACQGEQDEDDQQQQLVAEREDGAWGDVRSHGGGDLFGVEAVAVAQTGVDALAVGGYLLAQTGDVDVDGAVEHECLVGPHMVQDLFA